MKKKKIKNTIEDEYKTLNENDNVEFDIVPGQKTP